MKLFIRAILIIAFFALGISCSKFASPVNKNLSFSGSWNWLSTDGGIAYNIHDTPASTGKAIRWDFNNNYTYAIYENGMLQSKGNFTLTTAVCINDGSEKPVINFDNGTKRMVLKADAATLTVSDNAYDGTQSLFSRVSAK